MKKLKFNQVLIVASLAIVLVIGGCKKESESSQQTGNVNILKFKDIAEYVNVGEQISKMTIEEKENWVKLHNYHSIGLEAEKIYRAIDLEKFESFSDIENYVNRNDQYLKIISDSYGEKNLVYKYDNPTNYFFANDEGLFMIGDMVFKILDHGLAYTASNNINDLKLLDAFNTNHNSLDSKIFFTTENKTNFKSSDDIQYNCGYEFEQITTAPDGKNRTILRLAIDDIYYPSYNLTQVLATYLVKAQKKSVGIWFDCERTLSADLKVRIDYADHIVNHTWVAVQKTYYNPGQLSWGFSGNFLFLPIAQGNTYYSNRSHYGAIDCWADSPSTEPVEIECNTSLIN